MISKLFLITLIFAGSLNAFAQNCNTSDSTSCPEGYICRHRAWSGSPGFGTCQKRTLPNNVVTGIGTVCPPLGHHQTDEVFRETAQKLADRHAQDQCYGLYAQRRTPYEESSDQQCPNGEPMYIASADYMCQW